MPMSREREARPFRTRMRVALGVGSVMALASATAVAQQSASHGWAPLFDGRTLAGWKLSSWEIKDGALVTRGKPSSDGMCTEKSYGDFVLRFRVQASGPLTRTAVAFRTTLKSEGPVS